MKMNKFLAVALLAFATSPATAQIIPSGAQPVQGTEAANRGYPVKIIATDGSGNAVVPAVVAQGSTTSGQNGELMQCAITTAAPTYITGTTNPFSCDTAGSQRVASITVGNVANNTADSGNGVKVSGIYQTAGALSAITAGNRADLQTDLRANLRVINTGVAIAPGTTGTQYALTMNSGSGAATAPTVMPLAVGNYMWDGTNTIPSRVITGADGTGLGISGVAVAPHSSANGAIAGVVSAAVEGSHVLKASAGNLYDISVTTGGSAGYLMVFNAISAPADGAVTPAMCRVVAANSTIDVTTNDLPIRFSTGITAVFSTTGCFTKTISATAFIEGYVQ